MAHKARDKIDERLDLTHKWTQFLRQTNKTSPNPPTLSCPLCPDRRVQDDDEALWTHVQSYHAEKVPPKGDRAAIQKFRESIRLQAITSIIPPNAPIKPRADLANIEGDSLRTGPEKNLLISGKLQDLQQAQKDDSPPSKEIDTWAAPLKSSKKRALGDGDSPSSSVITANSTDSKQRRVSEAASPSQRQGAYLSEFDRDENLRPPTTGKRLLFEPDAAPINPISSQRPRSSSQQQNRKNQKSQQSISYPHGQTSSPNIAPGTIPISVLSSKPSAGAHDASIKSEELRIVRQPETRPISQEQLVAEVKGIYAGLVMVEGKCIQVDAKQAALAREASPGTQPKLNNEQWQALIALHRTLLHEHHDFFLASQHPSATPAVRKLATKYAMPARLWRHGIHSFLELLRNRLPDSLDHMLAFIYLAYSMMTLLYETVPAFEETWIECLGDLGRYRMAIEDDDIRDREVWTQVARQWYLKASDRSPETGRLYHHLAILARPNALQQLFFYLKALSVPQPFVAANESILTLFEPFLGGKQNARRFPPFVTAYVKVNAILFTRNNQESFSANLAEFFSLFDSHIGRVTQKYLEQGYYIAISNCLALLGFGSPESSLLKALQESEEESEEGSHSIEMHTNELTPAESSSNSFMFEGARQLFVQSVEINLQRVGDPNILSFLHITLIFMVHVSRTPRAMKLLEREFPWRSLTKNLNALLRFYHSYSRIESGRPPVPDKNDFRPSPEEFAVRGLFWTKGYFLPGWFRNKNIEDENQYKEDASMNIEYRPERILWLGRQLAESETWIKYNKEERKFYISEPSDLGGVSTTPSASSDLEAESGTESTADTATLMAECDVDIDDISMTS